MKCFVKKEQRNQEFVFTSVRRIPSMQAQYHIKTFRNVDTTIALILSKHSGTLNGVTVETLRAKRNVFLGCVPYYMYVF